MANENKIKPCCEMCEKEIKGKAFDSNAGDKVCQDCYDEKYSTCDVCGLVSPKDEGIFDEDGKFIDAKCFEDIQEGSY